MKRSLDGALNVREINLSKSLGTPNDDPSQNTVIGLLKSITIMLS